MLAIVLCIVIFGAALLGIVLTLLKHDQIFENSETILMIQYASTENLKKDLSEEKESVDSEIERIIARMEQITADIAELNKEHQQDRRNLTDIRNRYILYREPKHPNGGVEWAKDIRSSEDL